MLSRKDMFLHQEPNKIRFYFYDFSTIFNGILKLQLKILNQLYRGTLDIFFRIYTRVPGFRFTS
jgi:hypothetical protein